VLQLVVNAAQAIQEAQEKQGQKTKGTITVSTRQNGPWVEMRVADNGVGIPPENLSKIFDPFFTTRPVGQGRGQGLCIARSIVVDGHGGAIDVESKPGQGATFIVRLPVLQSAQEASGLHPLALHSAYQPLHADQPEQRPPRQEPLTLETSAQTGFAVPLETSDGSCFLEGGGFPFAASPE
jgi:hypothetical protein